MRSLDRILSEHRGAIHEYLAEASRVPESMWTLERGEGKWSPCQITEHLSISLERVHQELSGGPPLRVLLPAWKRWLARRRHLSRMLRGGAFPEGVKAPREIRPTVSSASRAEALERLAAASVAIDAFYGKKGKSAPKRLTHPYFGAIPAAQLFRVLTLHAHHHRRQLP